jgi:RNase P/RNase MRP subunit p29
MYPSNFMVGDKVRVAYAGMRHGENGVVVAEKACTVTVLTEDGEKTRYRHTGPQTWRSPSGRQVGIKLATANVDPNAAMAALVAELRGAA